jgi:hypothetical protein
LARDLSMTSATAARAPVAVGDSWIHPVKRTAAFRLLDRFGLGLPVGRTVRLFIHDPPACFRAISREAFAKPVAGQSVAVFALPKSGSTMTELVLRTLGLIDLQRSLLARTSSIDARIPGADQLKRIFRFVRPREQSFAKTHIAWHPTIGRAIADLGLSGVVQIRDLRDVLVSRYLHVMSDPRHRHHDMLRHLSPSEGLKRSFFGEQPMHGDDPLPYLARWTTSWMATAELPMLKYEDYLERPAEFLRSIGTVAGKEAVDIERIERALHEDRQCARQRPLSMRIKRRAGGLSTFRRGESGGWRKLFDRAAIDLVKEHGNDALVASGYETDDRW